VPGASTRSGQCEGLSEPDEGAMQADFYVVHSWHDSMDAKVAALQDWAQRWDMRHGRRPMVWMDVLTADPSLRSYENLQHMPAYLAKSKHLLILAGPTLADRLWAMMELYTWGIVGGTLDNVHVLSIAADDAERQKVIASFDSFAVMYARANREEDKLRLVHAVELAVVSRFNEVVRSYLPLIRQALDCAAPENPSRAPRLSRKSASTDDDESVADVTVSGLQTPEPSFASDSPALSITAAAPGRKDHGLVNTLIVVPQVGPRKDDAAARIAPVYAPAASDRTASR
jgi:hypothetical protein